MRLRAFSLEARPDSQGRRFVHRDGPPTSGAATFPGLRDHPPDLAVEVVSPNDRVSELDEKVDEYQRAGVKLILIIHPETRTVDVLRSDGSVSRLRAEDELSGEDVIPGFRCVVGALFPKPSEAEDQAAKNSGPLTPSQAS
jgi:hypothetical protein